MAVDLGLDKGIAKTGQFGYNGDGDTMDDVTSGFNIGKAVSIEPDFNRMLGFTQEDVLKIIEYYRSHGLIQHATPYLLEIMTQWYGNYCFSEDDDVRLFNPDMVLYFIDHYLTRKKLPDHLIDRNVRIDYRKLRHLIIVDSGIETGKAPNGNFDRLKTILIKIFLIFSGHELMDIGKV